MKRREFVTLLGGAAAALPMAARAQQGSRVRRIGILGYSNGSDPLFLTRMAALRAGLTKLGWFEDRNLRVEIRHGSFDPDLMRTYAAELIGFGPDLIIAT